MTCADIFHLAHLGGAAAYVSIAASRLEARVGVVSKVGGDFPEAYRWWLEQEGINLSALMRVEDAQTPGA